MTKMRAPRERRVRSMEALAAADKRSAGIVAGGDGWVEV